MKKNKYSCIVVNGKFLSQNITGVQRYAREIMLEIDKHFDESTEIIVYADKNARNIPDYKNIKAVKSRHLTGNLWEQVSLPLYAMRKHGLCVSLCNMAPVLKPDVVVIHDVSYKVNKGFFSRKFTLWYNFVFSSIIRRIKKIVTVSEFSKSEILRCYNIDSQKLLVTYNGWQHYQRTHADENALSRYGLTASEYYFSMSSMAPNKNFKWIASAAKNNPNVTFAVSGAVNSKVFGDIFDFDVPENLKFLGYVSDEEAKELTANCRAFLFPSFYEGFGIPPLEALSTGARAIVSDRSCMREIFGDCVYYISPDDPSVDLDKLISAACELPDELLKKYSWEKSASILYSALKDLIK